MAKSQSLLAENLEMADKQALLIGSTYGGLKGPINDVKNMAQMLGVLGFSTTECCGTRAKRDRILGLWGELIRNISPQSTVVIYYSGHGGMAESSKRVGSNAEWRHQYLVPTDFQAENSQFRGITDREISYLLKLTTERTKNVTIILDCCFAGRMARDPNHGDKAVARGIPTVRYEDLSAFIRTLESRRDLRVSAFAEENSSAVRIAAASPRETAWEYQNARGEWGGIMTEALISVISEIVHANHAIPWRTIMMRVSELVQVEFPQQHPCVEGCGNRHHFSLRESAPDELLLINQGNDNLLLQGGRLAGAHEGSLYGVMHAGSQIAEARITCSEAFTAWMALEPNDPRKFQLPTSGLTAILLENTLYKWPVIESSGIPELETIIQQSRFIRPARSGEAAIVGLYRRQKSVVLVNPSGKAIYEIPLSSSTEQKGALVRLAEQLGRAHHILALRPKSLDEHLQHNVHVRVQCLGNPNRFFKNDGTDTLSVGSRIHISLDNQGDRRVYAWVFCINGLGKVSSPRTSIVDIPAGQKETIGRRGGGLPVSWPRDSNLTTSLRESILLILTDQDVDLRQLTDPVGNPPKHRSSLSQLELLVWKIASGSRTIGAERAENLTQFGVINIHYLLVRQNLV
jgi:hypothetical protein